VIERILDHLESKTEALDLIRASRAPQRSQLCL